MDEPAPEILIPARSASPPVLNPVREDGGAVLPALCSLCLSGPGKYTCPRCNAPYCSLSCYRGPRHTACSELFYRDSVLQALREEEADPRDRRRIEDMLVKLREEEATADPATGMSGPMTGEEADLWNSLTAREKEDFHRLLKSGDIGCLVPRWKPWWEAGQQGHNKVIELQGVMDDAQIPDLQSPIQEHKGGDPSNGHSGTDHGGRMRLSNPAADKSSACPVTKDTAADEKSSACPVTKDTAADEKSSAYPVTKGTAADEKSPACPVTKGTVADEKSSACPVDTSYVEKAGSYTPGCTHQQHKKSKTTVNTEDPSPSKCPDGSDRSLVAPIPPLLKPIPPLSSLSCNPSPLVRFSLVNVLYSYAFSLLQHNGDLSDDDMLLNFTGTLLCVSGALSTTTVYNSTALAIKSAVRAATDPLLGGDEGGACFAIKATSDILLGDGSKGYSMAALSHLYRVLGKARKLETEEKDIKKGAFTAKKKCLFLAAWVNENESCLDSLSAEVMSEYERYLKDISEVNAISKGLQKSWGGKRPPEKKKLIQEVN